MYILVLEDDPFLCHDVCDTLLAFDIEVKGVMNCNEAVALIEAGRPTLALLDYNIRSETSVEVAERLVREDVPFAYVTAMGDSVRDDPRIPDCPVVGKPYRVPEILELVSQLLRG